MVKQMRLETERLIGKAHWNHGYASEAAAALLDYCFGVMNLDEVVALCKPENIGSRRVMEKIGMQYRGIMKGLPAEHGFFNGEPLYALTKAVYQHLL